MIPPYPSIPLFIRKYKPDMMCYVCGRDIPTDEQVRGVGMRDGIPILYCDKPSCTDHLVRHPA